MKYSTWRRQKINKQTRFENVSAIFYIYFISKLTHSCAHKLQLLQNQRKTQKHTCTLTKQIKFLESNMGSVNIGPEVKLMKDQHFTTFTTCGMRKGKFNQNWKQQHTYTTFRWSCKHKIDLLLKVNNNVISFHILRTEGSLFEFLIKSRNHL